jgi:hypothetical protein
MMQNRRGEGRGDGVTLTHPDRSVKNCLDGLFGLRITDSGAILHLSGQPGHTCDEKTLSAASQQAFVFLLCFVDAKRSIFGQNAIWVTQTEIAWQAEPTDI